VRPEGLGKFKNSPLFGLLLCLILNPEDGDHVLVPKRLGFSELLDVISHKIAFVVVSANRT
jgi:hypothetical protein